VPLCSPAGGYGGWHNNIHADDANDCIKADGLGPVLCVSWNDDNAGPPASPADVAKIYAAVRASWPGARVVASTLEAYGRELLAAAPGLDLPVLTGAEAGQWGGGGLARSGVGLEGGLGGSRLGGGCCPGAGWLGWLASVRRAPVLRPLTRPRAPPLRALPQARSGTRGCMAAPATHCGWRTIGRRCGRAPSACGTQPATARCGPCRSAGGPGARRCDAAVPACSQRACWHSSAPRQLSEHWALKLNASAPCLRGPHPPQRAWDSSASAA
jgi:hypothetical protein